MLFISLHCFTLRYEPLLNDASSEPGGIWREALKYIAEQDGWHTTYYGWDNRSIEGACVTKDVEDKQEGELIVAIAWRSAAEQDSFIRTSYTSPSAPTPMQVLITKMEPLHSSSPAATLRWTYRPRSALVSGPHPAPISITVFYVLSFTREKTSNRARKRLVRNCQKWKKDLEEYSFAMILKCRGGRELWSGLGRGFGDMRYEWIDDVPLSTSSPAKEKLSTKEKSSFSKLMPPNLTHSLCSSMRPTDEADYTPETVDKFVIILSYYSPYAEQRLLNNLEFKWAEARSRLTFGERLFKHILEQADRGWETYRSPMERQESYTWEETETEPYSTYLSKIISREHGKMHQKE